MSDVLDWMVRQMEGASPLDPTPERFNPRPPGVIREGGATEAVLAFFQAEPGRCFAHHQIVAATGRSPKSVDWGLLFLRSQDLITCFPDKRNARYWLYRLRPAYDEDEGWP